MADCKRKTANLFDKDNTTIYSAYFDASGSWLLSADSKSVKMPCQPNTQYTLSVPNSLAVFRVYESNNASIEPSSTSPPRATEITRGTNISQYTFTTSSTAQIILFQGSNGAVTEWFNGLMLNTGSTPLPYEPYGWLHSLRKLGTSTDTITTLPIDLYADGTNATVGLKGNMSQTGTPTPSSPIQPSECGDLTGNLWSNDNATLSEWISSNGEKITGASAVYGCTFSIPYSGATSYTIKYNNYKPYSYSLVFYDSNGDFISRSHVADPNKNGNIISVPANTARVIAQVATNVGTTLTREMLDTYAIMLNTGSTPLPYEPYGYKLTISSASTTTPVYLGEVESTRRIKKLVLTGEETITLNGKNDTREVLQAYYTLPSSGTTEATNIICSHLETLANGASTFSNEGIAMRANGTDMIFGFSFATINVSVSDSTAVALTKLMTYLAQQYTNGTPVTVWYVLAEPTTGIVNEPLRKIGDYADEVSGITIPTTTGKDTFDVLTTLKPSEVSLNYTGWHDASVGEWDGSDWQ